MLQRALIFVFWASLALVVASFAGALHGIGDSLAVFRHLWASVLAISSALLLRGHLRLAGLGTIIVVLAAAPMAAAMLGAPADRSTRYALYQKNLRYDGRQRQAIIDDILAVDADFVTLEEVGTRNHVVFQALATRYPSFVLCADANGGNVAVMSKWPLLERQRVCVTRGGPAAIKVRTPDGPVWAMALHLKWPWPRPQARQAAEIASKMGFVDAPVVLGGDFNMVPWSHTMRLMERATRGKRLGPAMITFVLRQFGLLRLPIDHVITPSGQGWLERRPLLGSDHYGLVAHFNL